MIIKADTPSFFFSLFLFLLLCNFQKRAFPQKRGHNDEAWMIDFKNYSSLSIFIMSCNLLYETFYRFRSTSLYVIR